MIDAVTEMMICTKQRRLRRPRHLNRWRLSLRLPAMAPDVGAPTLENDVALSVPASTMIITMKMNLKLTMIMKIMMQMNPPNLTQVPRYKPNSITVSIENIKVGNVREHTTIVHSHWPCSNWTSIRLIRIELEPPAFDLKVNSNVFMKVVKRVMTTTRRRRHAAF